MRARKIEIEARVYREDAPVDEPPQTVFCGAELVGELKRRDEAVRRMLARIEMRLLEATAREA